MTSSKKIRSFIFSGFCAAVVATVACAPAKTVVKTPETETPEANAAKTPSSVETAEANLRGSEFQGVEELKPVHFAFDAYALDPSARDQLQANAEYLKAHADFEILVAGYCDERGTIAYNLALGQRRAKAVREYYAHLGVPGKAIATISYGKEKPLCSERTEDCWSQNRRAETTVRARAAAKPEPGSELQPQ